MNSAQLLNLLSEHRGATKGIHVDHLAARSGQRPRTLRRLISALRTEGVPICGTPETGYFIAATSEEVDQFCIKYLESRALHSLKLSSRLRNISLPVLAGQLFLNQA